MINLVFSDIHGVMSKFVYSKIKFNVFSLNFLNFNERFDSIRSINERAIGTKGV